MNVPRQLRNLHRTVFGILLVCWVGTARAEPVTVGYVAAFKGVETTIAAADLDAFTHINLAFANPAPDGTFLNGDTVTCLPDAAGGSPSLETLTADVARLRGQGRKVLISLGGGTIPTCAGDWRQLLAADRRDATVAALIGLVDAAGLDGVDVDIEGALLTDLDRAGTYVPFIAAVSAAMKARGKLLTCATASYEGGMIPVASIPYFDLVNVMSYDAVGSSWGDPRDEHASYAMAERDLALWRARGVMRERLVLGLPFYGYGFNGAAPNWSYRDLAAAYPGKAAAGDRIGDACTGCRTITYNGPRTITRKARLAREKAGGVMAWELSQDTPDHVLTRALLDGLKDRGSTTD